MARTAEEGFKHTAEIAKAAGLTLLTTEWAGASANYLFRCSNGHEFERLATGVLYKKATRCPECESEASRGRWVRGRLTFEDVVRSHGADAAEKALDAEIASVQKGVGAAIVLAKDLKFELKTLMENHDGDAPLKKFRDAFKELLVIADVPEFSNVESWKLSKRPTDSGSLGPRSVVAYYGALWTVMKIPGARLRRG
jgi:hypothetical protein